MQPARHDILLPISQLQFLENAIFSLNLDDQFKGICQVDVDVDRRFFYYDSHISVLNHFLI